MSSYLGARDGRRGTGINWFDRIHIPLFREPLCSGPAGGCPNAVQREVLQFTLSVAECLGYVASFALLNNRRLEHRRP